MISIIQKNAKKYYYKNKVSHKEVCEKFNIKQATYFTYLKIYKESDFFTNLTTRKKKITIQVKVSCILNQWLDIEMGNNQTQ